MITEITFLLALCYFVNIPLKIGHIFLKQIETDKKVTQNDLSYLAFSSRNKY